MHRIATLNAISGVIYEALKPSHYEISENAENPDAILVRSADCRKRELNENLLAIARAGAGTNNIPIDRCTEAGVVVFNTPGANANAVKELALCCMLMASRNVIEGVGWTKTLSGDDIAVRVEQGKSQFSGHELAGKTLGVIGLGAIGVMVANAAYAIGMRVIGYDPFISIEHAWGLSRAINRANSLEEMLPVCEYVTIHVPLMDKTRNYISEHVLSCMKPGTMLLNLARGELVDNEALISAVESGILSRYVTDFPTEALLNRENIICVPHLGATTPESEENCARMAAEALEEYIRLGNIHNSVNMPECNLAPAGCFRICVMHKNSANMVGRITAIIGSADCNIANMINKSRGELAYTILDLDHEPAEEMIEKIAGISGVLRVRTMQTANGR